MICTQSAMNSARGQVQKLFEYLVEYSRLKSPLKLEVGDYNWHLALSSLPDHPSVAVFFEPGEDASERTLLRIMRPELRGCPQPEELLVPWLETGWEKFEVREACLIPMQPDVDAAEDAPLPDYPSDVKEAFYSWQQLRNRWRVEEGPARKAYQLFERFFELKGTLEREGERYALTLGEGIVRWKTKEGAKVDHPVLGQRCSLQFDPETPEFTVIFSDDGLQFPTGLIRELEGADLGGLPNLLETVRSSPFDILSEEAADFFRGMARRLWSQGEFYGEATEKLPEDHPSLRKEPVLLLSPRDRGYADAAEYFLTVLEDFELPTALLNMIGEDVTPNDEARRRSRELPLLFTKPSNAEQERVARRLESNGCVLVQGPPGTGKTHTIGNLIGHLLAQGKSILVTSHTSKALSVVRHQVVPQLQSLCVAVLDDGMDGQKHLESAVKSIADKLTETTGDELEIQAKALERQRVELERQIAENQDKLLAAHRSEYEDLVVGGEVIPPVEAARKLHEGKGQHDWIPGSLELGQVCPLRADEVEELYQLQQLLTAEDERLLESGLPDSNSVIDPSTLTGLAQLEEGLREGGTAFGAEYWRSVPSISLEHLEKAEKTAHKIRTAITSSEVWTTECMVAGSQSGEAKLWMELLTVIDQTAEVCTQRRSIIYDRNPKLEPFDWPLQRQIDVCKDLLNYAKAGKKFGFLGTLFKPEWKEFRKKTTVQNNTPEKESDFEALLAELELRVAREKLKSRWVRQMEGLKAPALPEEAPEREAAQLGELLREALSWEDTHWKPFGQHLEQIGLDWSRLLANTPVFTGSTANLQRRAHAISEHLLRILSERANALRLAELESNLADTYKALDNATSPLAKKLLQHAQQRDLESYRSCWEQLRQLEQQVKNSARRKLLLDRLRAAAPGWSQALAERMPGHCGPLPPGPLLPAWQHAQWSQQLTIRHQQDLNQLQARTSDLKEKLRKLTADYVEVLTWMYQARRTGNAQRQALNGWIESMRRIGKGTGKYAETYKAKAREKLKECRSAVPVWVMPFSRVVESYRPGETVFDVVIVDEASQADVTGLLAFALGKEVIVVGDDQQVSPTAFEQGDKALALAKERLEGIPNWELYSGKRSVYDMAKTAFGETIRLKEHFRCVPEIIAFSNELCYDGDIRPLRESDKTLLPAVVAHRVPDGKRQGKAKTNDEEAREITALIAACIEQPEYEGKTFGVISLVGDDQALLVQRYLTNHLTPSVLQSRRILCGNAAQFQGDERDVMFLSMVNSPNENLGPLRLVEAKSEDRQRFNVAASRARDQMWLVHSFNPSNDLKPQDLRARLLKMAEQASPDAVVQRLLPSTESVFEAQVLERLVHAGYRVIPQLPVGSYRIDMVVVGGSRRVAIECDGEAFHGANKVQEDLDRQQILERVAKLTFIRIRGSHYFRDPDEAMKRVFQSLQELGVEKLGTGPESPQVVDSQLKEAVIRRAQSMLKQWFAGGSEVRDPVWGPLLRLLQEWPVLRVSPYESVADTAALSIIHDNEEILVADKTSSGYPRLAEEAARSHIEVVGVDIQDPQAALRDILVSLNLHERVDSQEMPALAATPAPVEAAPASVQPVVVLPTAQAIVSLLMRVVKADGVLHPEELTGVADFFARRFGYEGHSAADIKSWIDLYANSDAPAPEVAVALRKLTRPHRELTLQSAIELAWCDNEFHPSEKSTIRSLGIELDLDRATTESLIAQNSPDHFDPLQLLGLTPLASPREMLQAVVELRERFDAKTFAAHGVEFQELAATRRAEIEKAWNVLNQLHNLDALEQARVAPQPRVTSTTAVAATAYRSFEGVAGPDPREASLDQIIDGLLKIVHSEAPVTTSRLYEAYLRGCGIKRLGGELRKTFSRALQLAITQRLIRLVEGNDLASLNTVVALPDGPEALVRERGPRTFEQIPDKELRAIGETLVDIYDRESEEHLRAILDHYDLKRLTTNTRDRLLDALAGRKRQEVSAEELE
jgi:very-short-patch-repair endonuclease/superfamily I DNA/RNA helicase/uncharacterized tellurite resistance protein B-like protein